MPSFECFFINAHTTGLLSYFLKGSLTTTFTPEIVPVTALRTCCTACELISPAAFNAPVAAADAASVVSRLISLAPTVWLSLSAATRHG